MAKNSVHIVIGGQAGQGMVTIGQMLAKALVRSGYFIVVTQSYQSRIRGGHNTFSIRTGAQEVAAPQEKINLLIALDSQTVSLHREDLSSEGLVVLDRQWQIEGIKSLAVPYEELAPSRSFNVAALGIVGALLGLSENILKEVLQDLFEHKNASSTETEENGKTLETAYQWTGKKNVLFPKLPALSPGPRRLIINGNEAIALGALSAGVKFVSFYPMTPATSIILALAAQAADLGIIVEQAEDEIGAVNMALGASFVGAPSLVCTSGGGFALMVEGVSLAGMTETPIVIVVAQRPGPATGLPTRTEQADLDFILHAGHGEFPRAILTPGTVEECFYLTRKAFEWAESFQTPIFILTDQFLADSYRAVVPFEVLDLFPVRAGATWSEPGLSYVRYALTENGISPRLLPGKTSQLVVADSDEHTEDGHLTEDLMIRKRMVEKRLRKMVPLAAQCQPPQYQGDPSPDLILVTWGSNKGAVLEAAEQLRQTGKRVGTFCFSQVWPLIPEQIIPILESGREVIIVEGNASGQLAGLLRRETGFIIRKRVLRYDGLPITPKYILRELYQQIGDD
jgi:2-oxoglutarate/2-oxoacid ferredoxin oxidoreductase subunit alpha